MDMKSKVVDVSSFLLFEATGDSEAGCFDPAMSVVDRAENDDDDDAESCSCDTTSDFLHGVRQVNSLEDKANVDDDDHEVEDGEVVEQQKEVHLYEKCRDDQRINVGGVAKGKELSHVSVDSTKTMNEMEKSRLFWEACLAS
ncbi:uncharacterized protein LOC111305150 [Durio zibethinus]|uniref:Uncharacterized protein LOC111305150 n=1 Tax=Durio zibethinus TaxID=66656 RepID=A0A6P6A062_DURZI|nr:uncharacterized protein LOC111305150 [Durio zibethinus]